MEQPKATQYTACGMIDDPDIHSVEIKVTLRDGAKVPVSSQLVARALALYLSQHVFCNGGWLEYCIKNTMSTMGGN